MAKSEESANVARVDLVGAGPGAADLVTLAGLESLEAAQVVVYDQLVSPVVLERVPPGAERIFVGKSCGEAVLTQSEINRLLVTRARAGQRVVRLKGGDPYVFGRGGEEGEYLRAHGIPFRVIPGVTAALGAAAYAGIPLSHREDASTITFVTAHDDPESPECPIHWHDLARLHGTLVVYMGFSHLSGVARVLMAEGRAPQTPAAVVSRATTPTQRVLESTLGNLEKDLIDHPMQSPALLVVGEVVRRRERLNWFEQLPLFGQRIIVTRPEEPGRASLQAFESLGAEVFACPLLAIVPGGDLARLDDAIQRIQDYDWLVLTSAHGVRHLLERIELLGGDARWLAGAKIAAIGPATDAALASWKLRADLVPAEHRSEGLIAELTPCLRGRKVLLARAEQGRELLARELSKLATVDEVAVYRQQPVARPAVDLNSLVLAESVEWITVSSPALVRALFGVLSAAGRERIGVSTRLASLSPLTSAEARSLGWQVAAEARLATWPSLVDAVCKSVMQGRVGGSGPGGAASRSSQANSR